MNIFVIFAHFAILVMTHALARSVFDSMLGQIFQKIPHLMRLRHNIYTKSVLRLDYVCLVENRAELYTSCELFARISSSNSLRLNCVDDEQFFAAGTHSQNVESSLLGYLPRFPLILTIR